MGSTTEPTARRHPRARLLLLIVVFLGVLLLLWRTSGGSKQRAPSNLVLISIDTTRADHLSSYGFARSTTPHIDRLADEGVRFSKVFSTAPSTVPAHSSMMTGTTPLVHGARDNTMRLSEDAVTLAEVLRDNGFETGAIVAASVLRKAAGLEQGFQSYDDQIADRPMPGQFMNQRRGSEVIDRALSWLEERGRDRFFLFVHLFDPHGDYAPPEPYATRFSDNLYAGEIAYADAHVGRLLAELKTRGLYDSTMVVVTSDHGEGRGDHGEPTHSYFVYQSTIAVPWVMHVPGLEQPRIIGEEVSLIDQMPTLLNLLRVPPPSAMQGRDLSPHVLGTSEPVAPDALYSECIHPTMFGAAPLFSVVKNGWKYIHSSEPELYNLADDSSESKNRIADEPDRALALRGELERHVEAASDRGSTSSAPQISAQEARMLESLGYMTGSHTGTEYDRDEARESAVALLPDFTEHAFVHGKTEHMRRGGTGSDDQGEQAEALLKRAKPLAERHPDVDAFQRDVDVLTELAIRAAVLRSAELVKQAQHEEALQGLRSALMRHPGAEGLKVAVAATLANAKRYDEALDEVATLLDRHPASLGALRLNVDILAAADRDQDALEAARKALEAHPKDEVLQARMRALLNGRDGRNAEPDN